MNFVKVADRRALKPRRDPYWTRLRRGCYIGFRKMAPDSKGTWLARAYDPESGSQKYQNLGEFDRPEHERFDAAKAAAEAWFEHLGRGGSSSGHSVADACNAYVEHQRSRKGTGPATDVEQRFRRWVISNEAFSSTPLLKLSARQVELWRNNLRERRDRDGESRTRTPSTINRDMTALRAALNLALENGHVTSDHAWKSKLAPIKNADRRRDVYLNIEDRRKLISCAEAEFQSFLKGLCLVPLRPGALAALKIEDFDERLQTLRVAQDKAGHARVLALPGATAAVFAEQKLGKSKGTPLFHRPNGEAWNKDAWKHPFKNAVASADIRPDATAYSLRHSVITDLVHGGLDTLTVAQLSGTSVAMIEKYYGHLTKEHAAAALAQLSL